MKTARRLPAPSIPAVLLFGILALSPGASAITTWTETAADFPSGLNSNTAVQNDALALDFNQSLMGNWTKVGDVSSPGPRHQHSMVYDPARGLHILFGGRLGDYILNDTWAYNMSRNSWTAGSALSLPMTTVSCSMAFDARNGVAVLFAGSTETSDTWTEAYDPASGSWVNKAPSTSPAARNLHSMAFDPATGRIVLFGGQVPPGVTGPSFKYLGDTWTYEFSTNTWTNRTSGNAPAARAGQSMAYDPASGLIVLFGGMNETTVFKDTWTFNPSTSAWSYCSLTSTPPARHGASMAADIAGGTVILFGGQTQTSLLQDTWSYNVPANAWTSKSPESPPAARWGMALTSDEPSGRLFYFGGQLGPSQASEDMDDYGYYDPVSNNWTRLGELAAPTPRLFPAAAFDGRRGDGILFGGMNGQYHFRDTWAYNASLNRWSRMHPKSSPSARAEASMCFDDDDGLMVLFGGIDKSGWLNDTWTYNAVFDTWTNRQPTVFPTGRSGCMAYDTESHIVIFFGGSTGNQTWTYNVSANLWTLKSPAISPSARECSKMVYDKASRLTVLFGGFNTSSALNDTWVFNSSSFEWRLGSPPFSPPVRWHQGMAFDSAKGTTVVFGGMQNILPPHTLLNDTWAYDAKTDKWNDLGPVASPSARQGMAMFYDSNLQIAVLFGGWDENYHADSWLFGFPGRYSSGTYTSAPHDTGGKAYFGNLRWQSSAPANTSVKLQFRTGSSPADMQARPFTGPDGTADTYFVSSGPRIPAVHNGSRWMQYRAYLESGELLKTPSVPSVTVDCNLLHSANIVSPVAGDNWTGSQWIRWTAADPDGDALLVDLYLVNETGAKETLAVSVPSGAGQFQWDNTLASPNGTYRISLVARDLSPSIPLTVETTSGQFTLFHNGTGPSGPNHPPFVIMRSPADGASLLVKPPASVMLEWNGSDPDGDDLVYSVYISSVIFNLSSLPLPAAQTARSNFSASALSDNTTYYWTVTASDRQAVSNGSVWKFSVKFGSPNIPPRITSLPPANATVGEELVYQVTAVDEDSGNITFSLTSSVEGMAIDPVTGRLNWTPRPFQTGDFPVALKASDGQGGYAEQKFIIIVGEPPVRRPTCHILLPKDKSLVRGTFWVNGSAANGTYGIVRLQVRIDQRGWKDAGRAAGNWSVQLDTKKIPNGAHTIEARSYDGRNYSDYASVFVNIRNPERNITIGTDPAGLLILAILFISALVLAWQQFGRKGVPPPPV